jgi:hypothetical protein
MADLLVTLTILAFFALCWWLVRACDRIIGPDEESDLAIAEGDPNEAGADEPTGEVVSR